MKPGAQTDCPASEPCATKLGLWLLCSEEAWGLPLSSVCLIADRAESCRSGKDVCIQVVMRTRRQWTSTTRRLAVLVSVLHSHLSITASTRATHVFPSLTPGGDPNPTRASTPATQTVLHPICPRQRFDHPAKLLYETNGFPCSGVSFWE